MSSESRTMLDGTRMLKVVLCGPSGVGKTCLVHRYVDGRFWEGTKRTIGVDFSLKRIELDSETTKITNPYDLQASLQLWDFAGESRFKTMLPTYARGSQGVLLSFDLSSPQTLVELKDWYSVITQHIKSTVPIILTGLKQDLPWKKSTVEDAKAFVKEKNLFDFQTTSSLEGTGVNETFMFLTRAMLATHWGIGELQKPHIE